MGTYGSTQTMAQLSSSQARGIDDAHFVVIKGGGHALNLTHPHQVNLVIEKFLASLAG